MAYARNLIVENARIIFRNFSGRTSQFNPDGKRSFALILNQGDAERLIDEGWNVKYLRPREPGDDETPYINVNVRYSKEYPMRDPKVWMVTGRSKTLLDEETVGSVDYVDISNVDLVISPYKWKMGNSSGITAYLKQAFIEMEDYFGKKYDFGDDVNEENEPW